MIKITISSAIDVVAVEMGFDGETFFVTCNGAVIAKRGVIGTALNRAGP
jgi:hypothetical protein